MELAGEQDWRAAQGDPARLDRTLAHVSQATGVSISNLSKIENDQISPSFDIMKRLCDGLGVSIEDFVRPGAKSVVSGARPPRAEARAITLPAASTTTAHTLRRFRAKPWSRWRSWCERERWRSSTTGASTGARSSSMC